MKEKRGREPSRRMVVAGLAAGAGMAAASPWLARAEEPRAKGPPDSLQSIVIDARPVTHFERSRPDARRFGELEFRGGLALTSSSPSFGALSGLVMDREGRELLLVSDVGSWLTADISYQGERPTGLSRARIGPLLDTRGRILKSKREQDAESLALLDGTLSNGTLLIGFERLHRIGRFPIRNREVLAPSGYLRLPPDARRMWTNQGMEALAVLQGGTLKGAIVAFAERLTGGTGYHTGWIWVNGEPERFQLRDIDGFNITDAASLPDGGLLILERRFNWLEGVRMRLRQILPREIAPGARLTGHVILEADMTYEIDNMEGLAVHRGTRGETVISLISDDNFNRLVQKTIFLQFTLLGEGAKRALRP